MKYYDKDKTANYQAIFISMVVIGILIAILSLGNQQEKKYFQERVINLEKQQLEIYDEIIENRTLILKAFDTLDSAQRSIIFLQLNVVDMSEALKSILESNYNSPGKWEKGPAYD